MMNGMTGSSWILKRFDSICLMVNSDEFRSVGNQEINFDLYLTMEFFDKYARIHRSDDHDAISAGGNDVKYSDVDFIDDEANVQDQGSSDYHLMNVTRDLQEALQDQFMSADLVNALILKILFPTTLK